MLGFVRFVSARHTCRKKEKACFRQCAASPGKFEKVRPVAGIRKKKKARVCLYTPALKNRLEVIFTGFLRRLKVGINESMLKLGKRAVPAIKQEFRPAFLVTEPAL